MPSAGCDATGSGVECFTPSRRPRQLARSDEASVVFDPGETLPRRAETRARALELCAEVSRRQGGAVPDVHDFNLPAIIDLQRRFGTRLRPSGEAGMLDEGAASGRFA
ncbi:hypothetical protein [Burkholderia pyrrocinia]|uniref:hypothetical protein n=1 Tax=Burkholderia pyrrocinia TaxID=60550 RepID=UPI001FC88E18|nr:hypothetical protein [Burkholderia pyrrocinia]